MARSRPRDDDDDDRPLDLDEPPRRRRRSEAPSAPAWSTIRTLQVILWSCCGLWAAFWALVCWGQVSHAENGFTEALIALTGMFPVVAGFVFCWAADRVLGLCESQPVTREIARASPAEWHARREPRGRV